MSRHEKLKAKLQEVPKNFTYNELVTLLRGFGYKEAERGRSTGSAVMFFHPELNDKIMFHRPHPEKEIKRYILLMLIEKLKSNNLI